VANLTTRRVDTSAVTDSLSGTDLERMPGPGLFQGWLASSVNTATVTVTAGRENVVRAQMIPLRSNGMPLLSDDPPTINLPVAGGERLIVATGGTTGTIGQYYQFTPEEDL